MSKIDRKRLARGTFLVPKHVYDPIKSSGAGAAAQINTAAITTEQLQTPNAPFRVNLHIPYIASDISDNSNDALYGVPFTLPPLQDYFSVRSEGAVTGFIKSPSINDSVPRVVLDELSFSFDQRAENCAIADQFYGDAAGHADRDGQSANEGRMSFDAASDLNFRISIREKTPAMFTDALFPGSHDAENVVMEKEIFGTDISSNSYTGKFLRNNPLVVTDINKSINPYATYMLIIDAKSLVSTTLTNGTLCLPSVIKADGSSGVSNELATIDKVFRDGLKGGYDRQGMTPAVEELAATAGYEVIAVPLFNNRVNGGVVKDDIAAEPNRVVDGGDTDAIWDCRVVPISHPITVHHVILAWNWSSCFPRTGLPTPANQQVPDTSTFKVETGVAIGTMLRSDAYSYNQIAFGQMTEPTDRSANTTVPSSTWYPASIDRAKYRNMSAKRKGSSGSMDQRGLNAWDWELHQVPILGGGSPAGTGYYPQGHPYYVGKNWSLNADRNNVYNIGGSSVVPNDPGCEQFIEVRMKIGDSAGLNNLASNSLVSFVYIICKKHLT